VIAAIALLDVLIGLAALVSDEVSSSVLGVPAVFDPLIIVLLFL
jgi:hypothetical protein